MYDGRLAGDCCCSMAMATTATTATETEREGKVNWSEKRFSVNEDQGRMPHIDDTV